MKLYAANIVTTKSIEAAGDNLDQEHIGIGRSTWVVVSAVEQEQNIKPFLVAVKQFYMEKMSKKFSFSDSLLRDLRFLQPKKLVSSTIDVVIGLAKQFPLLKLSDDYSSLHKLR